MECLYRQFVTGLTFSIGAALVNLSALLLLFAFRPSALQA